MFVLQIPYQDNLYSAILGLGSCKYFDMIHSTIILRFIWCAIISKVAYCSQASSIDLSATFPSDWCDKQFGTPTRTTGECICKGTYQGSGCILQQGLSFYSYSKCPTCKCQPPVEKQRIDDSFQPEKVDSPSRPKQQTFNIKQEVSDDDVTFSEWLEDNGRLIFAICASILVLFLVFLLLFFRV